MKRNVLNLLLTGVTIMISFFSQAQERLVAFGKEIGSEYINPYTGKIQCLSYQYSEYLRELNPENAVFKDGAKLAGTEGADTDQVLVIPVVVHVIHSGQAVGVGRNISDARVLSQLKY